MPELPEVETVARDLRPRILGATITGARCSWARTLRTHTPEAFAEADRRPAGRGRLAARQADRHRPVRRRGADDPPQDDRPAVRRPGRHARGPVRPAGPRAGRRPRGPLPRHPQVREDRAVRPRPGDRRAGDRGRRWRRSSRRSVRSRSTRRSRCATSGAGCGERSGRLKPLLLDQSFIAGVGNIYADEALWAARLHPLRTAGTLRPADERHLYEEVRRILAEAVERRGSSIDDYTAPDGDGSMQEHLQVYQRTGEPCPRCGRPVKRIVIGARSTHFCSWCQRLGAADRKGAAAILRTMTGGPRRAGGRWTELAGEGTRRADGRRSGSRVGAGTDRANETGRRDAPGGGPGVGAGRPADPAR